LVFNYPIRCACNLVCSFYFGFLSESTFFLLEGGEERAIEFMEREGRAASKMPLLEHGSEKGVVKHHFPMNLFLKPWRLGQWLYQVIKIGIVQYVCPKTSLVRPLSVSSLL